MRKKFLLVVAIMALVAISVTALVGCGVKSVEDFMEKAKDAKAVTVEGVVKGGEFSLQFDGKNMYTKAKSGIATVESYMMTEGDKYVMYSSMTGEWTKMTMPSMGITTMSTAKDILKSYLMMDLTESNYKIKDGVWTLKSNDKTTLSIKSGKLVLTQDKDSVNISLSGKSIQLPKAAKDAKAIDTLGL